MAMVNIDDLLKLDIRIVHVESAERMEGSDKLIRLKVNIGDETRQILAGVGKSYQPDDLVGRNLVAIVNLEPRKMMGEESQGMILATGDELDKISLLQPDKDVEAGSKIR